MKTSHYNQVECNLVNGIKPWSRWCLVVHIARRECDASERDDRETYTRVTIRHLTAARSIVHLAASPYGDRARSRGQSFAIISRRERPTEVSNTHPERNPIPRRVDFDAASVGPFRPRRSLADFDRTNERVLNERRDFSSASTPSSFGGMHFFCDARDFGNVLKPGKSSPNFLGRRLCWSSVPAIEPEVIANGSSNSRYNFVVQFYLG